MTAQNARTVDGPSSSRTRLAPTSTVVRWLAGTALVAASVLVLVLIAGGGAPQPSPAGLPDAGPLTGYALPVVRLIADLAGIATLGLLLAAAVLLPSPAEQLRWVPYRGVRLAVRTAVVWFFAVLVEIAFTISDILGTPVSNALDPALVHSFVVDIPQGRALAVQALMAVVLAGVARSVVTTTGAAAAAVLACLTLTPPALTGHSAASGNHELAVASLLVHVLAASVWVGGLAGLVWAAVGGDGLRHALPRFSRLALWCFVTVAISGIVNAGVRLGALGPLVTSSYGVLVLAKSAALLVLGGFGWWHRARTVHRLDATTTTAGAREDVRLFLRIAAGELIVMSATVALAVGLSRTPTPVGDTVNTSPAAELLGFPLPPAPTLPRLLFGWTPDGFTLALVVFAGLLYAVGLRCLHRRGVRWPLGRTLCWYAGLLVVLWATAGGLGLYSNVLFSAHMVSHMLLSMVAPIGLVLAAPVTLALRTLPGPRVPGELGPRQLLLAVLHSWPVRLLTQPLVALALWVGSLYGLYFTSLFSTLMSTHLGHVAMQLHFLTVGSLFFWVLIGVDPNPQRWHPLARMGLLLAAMPFHAFFSIAIMSSSTVLNETYFRTLDRPYSTDLLADQHLGGGIGWSLSELPVLLVAAAIFVQWARADHREATRLDRTADRAEARVARRQGSTDATSDADEFSRYNAYLASLSQRPSGQRQSDQRQSGQRRSDQRRSDDSREE